MKVNHKNYKPDRRFENIEPRVTKNILSLSLPLFHFRSLEVVNLDTVQSSSSSYLQHIISFHSFSLPVRSFLSAQKKVREGKRLLASLNKRLFVQLRLVAHWRESSKSFLSLPGLGCCITKKRVLHTRQQQGGIEH